MIKDLRRRTERLVGRDSSGGDSRARSAEGDHNRQIRACGWERAVAQAFKLEFFEYLGINEGRRPPSHPLALSKATGPASEQAKRLS
jgi:hypothetical protein